ncbi:PilC/PilY family type IV pilus protein [Desulfosarcina alkanivorans]|nr:PilC/PilY family type IV pilus protein [Desulfosarcina alkanivorans]
MKTSMTCRKTYAFKLIMAALAGACLVALSGGYRAADAASCMDLADVPLESMEQPAPGMIMFVIDDSGSMDWSMMCPPSETHGVFDEEYYIFPNPGDHAYTGFWYSSVLENNTTKRMMWMSQWSGYNGMYYDPATEYTPWPNLDDADVDNPRSNPVVSGNTLNMNAVWHPMENSGVVVDNTDPGFDSTGVWNDYTFSTSDYGSNFLLNIGGNATYSATWTADSLDSETEYDVYARLPWNGTYDRTYYLRQTVTYSTYDGSVDGSVGSGKLDDASLDQHQDPDLYTDYWAPIASSVSFSSGTGIVRFEETTDYGDSQYGIDNNNSNYQLFADAVKFVPARPAVSDIMRRHYYVQNDTGTYLVNLIDGSIEYYRVALDDSTAIREVVTAEKLTRLRAGDHDDEITALDEMRNDRSYDEEIQNFANWYSFYRRRELTAKNAIANVIDSMDGVFIGIFSLNGNMTQQRVRPVRVNLDGTFTDESDTLLDELYELYSSGGTPLRDGLKRAGRFFQGDYMKPTTSFPSYTSSATYPFFNEDKGGTCQQAFTIIFSDGYYNGTTSPGVSNADGNNNTDFDGDPFGDDSSDTLADVAMHYFETDLNDPLDDDVPITSEDPAGHQHMVTYTLAFGVTGTLDIDLYKDCPLGTCPDSWPSPDSDSKKIDDMFHAAINGRGVYLSAGNTAELNEALQALKKNIESRLGASAALATNSIQLSVGSVIYQGTYNTANWYGEVSALPLNVTTGAIGDPVWRASDQMPDWGDRTILSHNGSTGIVFHVDNLTDSQKTALTDAEPTGATAAQIVDFIRGDTSNSVSEGGSLRNRTHPIGDIVHSAPTYFKNVVYIGANDGMLHAFNSSDGTELFAYVPGLVYDHLGNLADPGYSHKYYVDNTAVVAKVNTQDVLVCGLGKGGKGYFALDVTQPDEMDAADVLWEFTDTDMGYSFSKAFIVKTKAAGHVVVFGNGYDNDGSGNAVLYVLDALTGSLVKKFDTGVGGCNGLSTPALVDVQLDGYLDYAFAGDLKGNMWKLDLRGEDVTDWKFSYQDGDDDPKPLITVKNPSGQIQPITAAPEVMLDCVLLEEGRGLMVIFGTGQYLNVADFTDTTTQSFYGIWDWGLIWEAEEGADVAESKYLGTFNADRSLSNMDTGITLLEQEFEYKDTEWGVLTDHQPQWFNPFEGMDGEGLHMGWHIDLPESGERMLLQPTLTKGAAILMSTIPSSSPCTAGGSSGTYTVSACTGGHYKDPVYDVNGDGKIDKNDTIIVDGEPVPPQWHPDPKILYDLLIISGDGYRQDAEGNIEQVEILQNLPGMFFWRVIGQ